MSWVQLPKLGSKTPEATPQRKIKQEDRLLIDIVAAANAFIGMLGKLQSKAKLNIYSIVLQEQRTRDQFYCGGFRVEEKPPAPGEWTSSGH